MWIDPCAEIRVALHAVGLLMAGRASIQVLARRATMLKKPERLRVVKDGAPRIRLRGEPHLPMAGAAKRLGGVAGSAFGFARVRLRRVQRDEILRMITSSDEFTSVTLGAEALGVAPGALQLTGGRHAGMGIRETRWVHADGTGSLAGRWYESAEHRSQSRQKSWWSERNELDAGSRQVMTREALDHVASARSRVTGFATRPRVTDRAPRRLRCRDDTVVQRELLASMILGRRIDGRMVARHLRDTGVGTERADQWLARGVDVASFAAFPRMTDGAARHVGSGEGAVSR